MHYLPNTPGAIIGWTRRGPIRVQAGGSETVPEPAPTDPAPTDPAPQPAQETDWKVEARKWEKRAKENSSAAEELDKVRKASMTEIEKAVEKARKEGESTALVTAGRKLAAAKFETALARKGLDLGDAADLIDTAKFVDDKGDVDEAAIKKAVDRLAKLAPKAPSSSGGDFGGGNGSTGTNERPKSIREAYARAQT
ncbi:hypothetical protein [Streptosporangium sp. NPDC049376]|uniref:hypothetical protein n=1 Tax=Streptosporangium sp. NPDC049376 TaxID=3366192 RepID=UPI00379A1618